MTSAELFTLASRLALAGWVMLVVGLFAPTQWARRALLFGGRVIPILLCAGYAAALVRGWGTSSGGNFSTLDGVATLFSSQAVLLAAWIHFLAFDLWIGRWEVDQTMAGNPSALLKIITVPCLFLTLMFGPVGLLLYLIVRRFVPAKDN
jgi:Domain of unknown function (DUF4281)